MRKVNCFDVVEMVVDEANKRFAPIWELDQGAYRLLEIKCEMIDQLMDDCDADTLEVEADEINMQVKITVEGTKPRTDLRNFFLAGYGSHSFGLRIEGKRVKLEFVFPSLWKRGA